MPPSRYIALKEQQNTLVQESRALDLATDEGKTRLAAIEGELATVAADLLLEERRRELERTLVLPGQAAVTVGRDRALDKPWGFDAFALDKATFVAAYPAPQETLFGYVSPAIAYEQAGFGTFLQAVYRAQTGQGIDPRLHYISTAQGAGQVVGPDGGFLVRKTQQDQIKLRMAAGELMRQIVPTPLDDGSDSLDLNVIDETSRVTGSRHGGVRGYWLDEGTSITASRPKFRRYELKVKALAALGYATNNLLRNARALGATMIRAFGDELRFLVEDSLINGSGAGKPLGMLSAPCLITQDKETNQAATTIVYENLSKMWTRLLPDARKNACWCIHSDTEHQLDTLVITAGTGGLEPRFITYGADGVMRIKGKPVLAIEYAASLGTVGDIILCNFADEYGFIEVPIEEASSMHVAFTTNEMCFRVMYYVDGAPYMKSAIVPFKGNTTQSCCVALATRS